MEMAIAAGAALGLGGGSAAATGLAGTAAAGAGAGLFGGSGVLTILQGVATAISAFGAISAANADAQQAEDMAIQADLQAGQEKVQGEQRQTALRRELFRVLGDNDVSYAAAGIDISSGIAESGRQSAQKRAADELTIERRDQEFRSALLRARATGHRRQAASARSAGMFRALGSFVGFGMDLAGRG
jgi:hypothetical protein